MCFLNLQGSQRRHKQLRREICDMSSRTRTVCNIYYTVNSSQLACLSPIGGEVWTTPPPIITLSRFADLFYPLFSFRSLFMSLIVHGVSLFSFNFILTCLKCRLYHKFIFQACVLRPIITQSKFFLIKYV
jgi:hypothetical protein